MVSNPPEPDTGSQWSFWVVFTAGLRARFPPLLTRVMQGCVCVSACVCDTHRVRQREREAERDRVKDTPITVTMAV